MKSLHQVLFEYDLNLYKPSSVILKRYLLFEQNTLLFCDKLIVLQFNKCVIYIPLIFTFRFVAFAPIKPILPIDAFFKPLNTAESA